MLECGLIGCRSSRGHLNVSDDPLKYFSDIWIAIVVYGIDFDRGRILALLSGNLPDELRHLVDLQCGPVAPVGFGLRVPLVAG